MSRLVGNLRRTAAVGLSLALVLLVARDPTSRFHKVWKGTQHEAASGVTTSSRKTRVHYLTCRLADGGGGAVPGRDWFTEALGDGDEPRGRVAALPSAVSLLLAEGTANREVASSPSLPPRRDRAGDSASTSAAAYTGEALGDQGRAGAGGPTLGKAHETPGGPRRRERPGNRDREDLGDGGTARDATSSAGGVGAFRGVGTGGTATGGGGERGEARGRLDFSPWEGGEDRAGGRGGETELRGAGGGLGYCPYLLAYRLTFSESDFGEGS